LIDFINVEPGGSGCADVPARLRRRDAALWSSDPDVQHAIDNRLGWLDAAGFMDRNTHRIVAFVDRIKAAGYHQAMLLGMGGSSLAPEVYASVSGPGAVDLAVADSTAPGHVRHLTSLCERAPTLFIVSSKSGTTAETSALEAHFFEWARAHLDNPGEHFITITDPGSPLQALAAQRGYRETFLNPVDIGGRYSALSFFGLVPGALAGVDVAALRRYVPATENESPLFSDACRLGGCLGALAARGRNKLTLHLGADFAPLAAWIEQLIDESTGKNGAGIVVVAGEPRLAADHYSKDRVFAIMDGTGELDEAWVGDLEALGHPILRWRVAEPDRLGAEFYRWEVATAAAGHVLGINPFDEPDVNDSKAATRAVLEHPGGIRAEIPQGPADLSRLLQGARAGDYIAILAFLPPTAANRKRLSSWRTRLTRRTGLPCCVAFGPRYLHSSGQLHKGGPDQGLFIVLTLDSNEDVSIPGRPYGFKALIAAQGRGDLQVLRERGRRVVHLETKDEGAGLDALLGDVP